MGVCCCFQQGCLGAWGVGVLMFPDVVCQCCPVSGVLRCRVRGVLCCRMSGVLCCRMSSVLCGVVDCIRAGS